MVASPAEKRWREANTTHIGEKSMYTYKEYHSGHKHWAVYTPNGELLCVCMYKKGAKKLVELLNTIILPTKGEDRCQ